MHLLSILPGKGMFWHLDATHLNHMISQLQWWTASFTASHQPSSTLTEDHCLPFSFFLAAFCASRKIWRFNALLFSLQSTPMPALPINWLSMSREFSHISHSSHHGLFWWMGGKRSCSLGGTTLTTSAAIKTSQPRMDSYTACYQGGLWKWSTRRRGCICGCRQQV